MESYSCISCGYNNPTNNFNFCSACGKQLVQTCTSCGQNNPSNFNFCSYCGTLFDNCRNFQAPKITLSVGNTIVKPEVSEVKQITSGNKNVVQNSKDDNNISVGMTEGGLTINYRRPIDKPFQAPPLPKYYVDRPEYSQELKKRLLTKSSDARTLVVTAIHGLGSIGKSILTTALAHDTEVQARFSDGILWATLGQEPNLLSLLSGWVQALGDYDFKATSVEATSNHLRTLLYDKEVLLVIDDAWNTEHAQAFNVGGGKCQVLVTTRETGIAQVLGASKYSIRVMKPSQAMELLTKKLGRNLADTEIHDAEILAALVGYLPLALDLMAAIVADFTSWKVLLQNMQQEVARLKTLDDPSARDANDEISLKRLSLTASLNLSVQQLSKETREDFIWLGILAEDVNITQKMVVTLWGIDNERSAADELRYLNSKALLLSGVPLPDETPTYRLHDLFHHLARNLLTAPEKPKGGNLPGLGKTLRDAHATFLDKYRHSISNNLWHTLSNDGYIHQHLVWHLEKAQKVEEIHKLLREESETGGNGWYEACEKLGLAANFVTDVSRALKLAEDDKQDLANMPSIIGLQCRYALIIASLNSLAAYLPAELLIALVQKEVWTPERGLAYVLQSSNPEQKAKLLIKLANYLPSRLKQLALLKALAAARQIQDDYSRADALSSLANKLPQELLPEALTAVKEIQDEYNRADAINSLADKLPRELLPEVLAATRQIQPDEYRAKALSSLANKLPRELLPEALTAARQIQDEYYRAKALSSLVNKLPEILPEALAAARQIQDEYYRNCVLSSLADKLSRELLLEALAAVNQIQSDEYRADAISSLADKLPRELLPEVLTAARQIQSDECRAKALSSLADKLPRELLPEVLTAARQIQSDECRAKALSSLADKLPEILPEALAAARQIQDEYYRDYALSSLADKLPQELLPEALAAARQINDEYYRDYALSSLASQLPRELLPKAPTAGQINSNEYGAKALNSSTDKLPEILPEALAAATQINDEYYRADVLSSLADKLVQIQKTELFSHWRDTLHILSLRTRSHLLSDINALTPIIFTLGGEQAVKDTASAIQDVSRWWF
jgi:ribosomal protein L17